MRTLPPIDTLAMVSWRPECRPGAKRSWCDAIQKPSGGRGAPAGAAGAAAPTGGPRTAAYDAAVPRRRSCRALRYSATTISVSSSAEVSELSLSKVILPSWIMFTRSDTSSTWP